MFHSLISKGKHGSLAVLFLFNPSCSWDSLFTQSAKYVAIQEGIISTRCPHAHPIFVSLGAPMGDKDKPIPVPLTFLLYWTLSASSNSIPEMTPTILPSDPKVKEYRQGHTSNK